MNPSLPDAGGHFGGYGGRYVPEVLMSPLDELECTYSEARRDPAFQSELDDLLRNYAGRPTPLYYARRLSNTWKARGSISSVRIFFTPGRTRSTTVWGRHSLPGAWASGGSSQKRARDSMELRPPLSVPCLDLTAPSTWVKKTCAARGSMFSGCGFWEPR